MKLQLLDPDTWAVMMEDGGLSVVPVKGLAAFLDKKLPPSNVPNVIEKLECGLCLAVWTDMRPPDEIFTNCPECKAPLTLDRQNWKMN